MAIAALAGETLEVMHDCEREREQRRLTAAQMMQD